MEDVDEDMDDADQRKSRAPLFLFSTGSSGTGLTVPHTRRETPGHDDPAGQRV
jgi:hypothetical protein